MKRKESKSEKSHCARRIYKLYSMYQNDAKNEIHFIRKGQPSQSFGLIETLTNSTLHIKVSKCLDEQPHESG
ncbi:hypothetical protein Bhyg_14887 [Pseudolycoriella hygida]|uniref:Uncharacterized protein n=1 Tax=Pseudolycoriella hygida TaxID=35572 RepID=A0A9Q0MSK0_9DIPT|nr:hypothetical protein Bhyg_14887 [Pseudolycoriella hygida]